MTLVNFQIVFDSNHNVYYAGQNIHGKVLIDVNSAERMRGVKLTIKGDAEVEWRDHHTSHVQHHHHNNHRRNHGRHNNRRAIVYKSSEVYFENKNLLYSGGAEETLQAGHHSFPFSFVLPTNIPSSFEGEYGRVRYSMKAKVDRPWKFDHETLATFSVISPLDLNFMPNLATWLQASETKTFCCFWCASAPLTITLSLSSGGSVPGQVLMSTIEVENLSSVTLIQVHMLLVKTVTFLAQGQKKITRFVVAEKFLGSVQKQDSKTLREHLQIPPLPPSNLSHCSIINIDYKFEVIANPTGLHRSIHVSMPVVIGTIPFHQQFNTFQRAENLPPTGWNLRPTAPELPDMGDDPPPSYPEMPPPTYEESVYAAASNIEGSQETSYVPKYPVYNSL